MFQAALDRMKDRQTETEEFAAKMNRLTQRLDEEVKALDRMDQPGDETKMLAENTVTETDARKALALLKLKMRKWEEKG